MEFAIDYQNGNGIYRKEAGGKRTKKPDLTNIIGIVMPKEGLLLIFEEK